MPEWFASGVHPYRCEGPAVSLVSPDECRSCPLAIDRCLTGTIGRDDGGPPDRSASSGARLGGRSSITPRAVLASIGVPGFAQYICGGTGGVGSGSSISVIVASAKSSTPATDTACSSAVRTTLVGSMMPSSSIWP